MIPSTSIPQLLHTPIWVYCFETKAIIWANNAALQLWEADSIAELSNRNLGGDMSLATLATLNYFRSMFKKGESIRAWWDYTPKDKQKKTLCHFSGVTLDSNAEGMLVEVLSKEECIQRAVAFSEYSNNAMLIDKHGQVISFNAAFIQSYSPTVTELSQFLDSSTLASEWLSAVKEEKVINRVHHCFTGHQHFWFRIEMRWLEESNQMLLHLVNIDAERRSYLAARYESDHDLLTNLLNRKGLYRKIEDNYKEGSFEVLFIDIDAFKAVNDSYGHLAGDQLLIAIAKRIASLLPEDALLARFGGDEFIVIIPEQNHIADLIVEQCGLPFYIDQIGEIKVGCSIGIAHYPEHSMSIDQLFKFADIAMLSAKKAGRGLVHNFAAPMLDSIRYKSLLRQQLGTAIKEEHFELHYQPIYQVETGEIASVEALLRWHDPLLGQVSPANFIPFVEECGMMPKIGLWVIEQACKRLNNWNGTRHWKVNVNLSPCQLTSHFVDDVIQLTTKYGIAPDQLVFEITETAIVQKGALAQECLQSLRDSGFALQLDDFGSGYANFDRIASLPITAIKLDRQFVKRCTVQSQAIIQATQLICNACGFDLIAEGVETEEQLKQIRTLNIDYCQGFLLAKPMPADQIENINVISPYFH
ncbi:putative bifunctional diguanylate cyclase/phosphodiesterase [Vibrio sp. WXL210]|uniref:putative bifunctional diguanylate cyclase/phosphodiesterase n=1 Tax=Vibrio sp. WXL210 TaxID=3450709 RepID=UPI003EC85008